MEDGSDREALERCSSLTNQIDTALKDGTITEDEFNILITKLPAQESLNAEIGEQSPKVFEEQAEEERVWLESSDVPIYEAYFTSEFLMNEKKLPPPEYLRDEVSLYTRRREQLVQFYEEHNPDKVENIDDLLANYKFKEILESLMKCYGVAPQGWEVEQATEELVPSNPRAKKDEYARFRAATREHQQRLLENGIIEWKRRHPDSDFEEWLKSEMSGNIRFDKDGNVEWIDPRSGNLKFTFHKMRPFDPLNKIGDTPTPDDFADDDLEDNTNPLEIDDLF
jgi:hypothetical protein